MVSSAPAATMATMTAARTTPAQPRKSTAAQTEQERMTIFGARKPDSAAAIRGKPRFLGLILTGVLLVFLAGVAAFSSIGTDTSLRGFFGGDPETGAPQDIALPAPAHLGHDHPARGAKFIGQPGEIAGVAGQAVHAQHRQGRAAIGARIVAVMQAKAVATGPEAIFVIGSHERRYSL